MGVIFSANEPSTAIARSSGAAIIFPLVTKINEVLRQAAANAVTTTNLDGSTTTTTAGRSTLPLDALKLAQTGAALHAILDLA